MNDNDLLAISELLDKKLKPIYKRIDQTDKKIEDVHLLLENNVIPRLQQIESCYTDTYDRYAVGVEKIDAIETDVDVLKRVVQDHSEKLKAL
ncbi:MAG: hypothetical protein HFE75_11615 [Firmicutes bacterium]|jgi:hypothetical protein|nr:hypothetical protein [Bacillota bacterium]